MNNGNYEDFIFDDMSIVNDVVYGNNTGNSFSNISGPYEGYIRGNMFNNLYDQYKNYKPAKLIPNNEEAELLLNIDQLTFSIHDLRLYLDINPNDSRIIDLYNKYQIMLKKALNDYEGKYGPIDWWSLSKNNAFSWEAYSFPWEEGDK